jgi:hypothetical protein
MVFKLGGGLWHFLCSLVKPSRCRLDSVNFCVAIDWVDFGQVLRIGLGIEVGIRILHI